MTMNSNDILRRLRYMFDLGDARMIEIFGLAEQTVTRAQVSSWLKKESDADFHRLSDKNLATFLNGLIIAKRGRKEGPQPVPEQHLTNNIVFRKLKIALKLEAEEVLAIIKAAGMSLSKHELSALFRKPGHKHYRECQDQLLRNFLSGLQQNLRGPDETPKTAEV